MRDFALALALLLSASSCLLSALLYVEGRDRDVLLRDASVAACDRNNQLRRELNAKLREFGEDPTFGFVDCDVVYPPPR